MGRKRRSNQNHKVSGSSRKSDIVLEEVRETMATHSEFEGTYTGLFGTH